jgi:hypothetical protein
VFTEEPKEVLTTVQKKVITVVLKEVLTLPLKKVLDICKLYNQQCITGEYYFLGQEDGATVELSES